MIDVAIAAQDGFRGEFNPVKLPFFYQFLIPFPLRYEKATSERFNLKTSCETGL
jgi:hypothetical protein